MNLHLEWYDWIGILGTLMVLVAFFLLQSRRLHGNGLAYQLLNLFGAAGVLVSLWDRFNPSVFVLELTWVAISAYGILRSFKAKSQG